MKMQAQLTGDAGLKYMLEELPSAAFQRVLRPALTAGAQPVTRAAKAGAPKVTRALSKSIGSRIVAFPKSNTIVALIGPRRGPEFIVQVGKRKLRDHVPANIAHLVHDGTKPHFLRKVATAATETYTTKRGRVKQRKVFIRQGRMHPGAKANPFIRAAWNASQASTVAIIQGQIAIRTPLEAAKLAVKGK